MQYLLLLHADENGWSRMTAAEQQQGYAAYMAYTEALKKAAANCCRLAYSAELAPPCDALITMHPASDAST